MSARRRGEAESYKDYRENLRREEAETRQVLKGAFKHVSVVCIPETGMLVGQETYHAGRRVDKALKKARKAVKRDVMKLEKSLGNKDQRTSEKQEACEA